MRENGSESNGGHNAAVTSEVFQQLCDSWAVGRRGSIATETAVHVVMSAFPPIATELRTSLECHKQTFGPPGPSPVNPRKRPSLPAQWRSAWGAKPILVSLGHGFEAVRFSAEQARLLMHPDRHYLRRKLNFVTKMVTVICWSRNQTQKQEQTEPQPSEQAHIPRRQ